MRVAVYGDIHSHWLDFRESVVRLHAQTPLDLVLQCGDAQPFRDEADLEYMHCPKKYRELGEFWGFHQCIEEFPVPLLFIGGNHEPWGYLDEHRNGGRLAPNIEFLGRAGIREVGGLRIAGISGNYSPEHFHAPHPSVPYPISRRKEATYYNQDDVDKALEFGSADILLLHNWPDLMNAARDAGWPVHWGQVGCEYLSLVVEALGPRWVFCGHMHFPARHRLGRTDIVCLSDFHRDPANALAVMDT
jgi:Icc-related predicted phosphoesterase